MKKQVYKFLFFLNKYLFKLLFGISFKFGRHNGIEIYNYPENSWYLIPFPSQKGIPFNFDNLATVNRHNFINDIKFIEAKKCAEARWKDNDDSIVRNISWRLHTLLWGVSLALQNTNIENEIFLECGTGKGYMAAGIINYFNWGKKDPNFYLIDTFKSTMPDKRGIQNQSGKKLFAYANGDEQIRTYFAGLDNIIIVTGFIPDALTTIPKNKIIKFLHLDLNNPFAENAALHELKNQFIKGTVIIFDDYGGPFGEEQALVHEEFAKTNGKMLLVLPTGQAMIIW